MNPKDFIYEIDAIFNEKECLELITRGDHEGWEFIDSGIANYHRSIFIDANLANIINTKIKHLLPTYFNGERIIKINDHFRMSKYTKNGRFEIHKDGINTDKDGNRACMTLNIFLNIPEKGGGTIFYTDEKTLLKNVRPKKGRGTLFYNQIYHEGEVVEKGQKYLLRTDVMSNLIL